MQVCLHVRGGPGERDAIDVTKNGEGDGKENNPVSDVRRAFARGAGFSSVRGHRLMHHIMSQTKMPRNTRAARWRGLLGLARSRECEVHVIIGADGLKSPGPGGNIEIVGRREEVGLAVGSRIAGPEAQQATGLRIRQRAEQHTVDQVKIVVLEAMPNSRVREAISVKPGFLRKTRSAYCRSCRKVSMATAVWCTPGAANHPLDIQLLGNSSNKDVRIWDFDVR